jgi:hypothetical protein
MTDMSDAIKKLSPGRLHRRAEDLVKRKASSSPEFLPTLRGDPADDRSDTEAATASVLKTVAAFLNTEGGDLLIGVSGNRALLGMEREGFESDDAAVRYLVEAVHEGLGELAAMCVEPSIQMVDGRMVCVVSCQRSPSAAFLKGRGAEPSSPGELFIRKGPRTVKVPQGSVDDYVRIRSTPLGQKENTHG